MQNYRNLIVWQKGDQLTLDVYRITRNFPKEELYGLTSQLRRASYSIPSNLAEGTRKLTDLDFRRFVSIAFGSVNELEYFIYLSYCLNYISNDEYIKIDAQSNEVKRMLLGLINRFGKRIIASVFFVSILFLGRFFLF